MARSNSIVRQFSDLKREYRQDYSAATPSRFRRQRSGLHGTADAHYADERKYFEVVEVMRDMERNDPILRPLLNMAVGQQVQNGFKPDFQTPDEGLNKELRLDWEEWAEDRYQCDIANKFTFVDFEEHALRSMTRDGDMVFLPTEDGYLQALECERLKTPRGSSRNIVHGVELNSFRRPIAYFVTKGTVDPMTRIERVGETTRIPALDEEGFPQVFHILHERRVTQTRGVSEFIAAQDLLGMRDDVEFALLIKQQLAAFLVGVWENSNQYDSNSPPVGGRGGSERDAYSNQVTLEDVEPGTILNPPPGKSFKLQSTTINSQESMDHLKRIIQIVGLQVAMPLIMQMLDASETNFSGWRGAVDVARLMFKSNQRHLSSRFHSQVAVWRLRWRMRQSDALARGMRKAYAKFGKKLFWHRWKHPRWPYVQPYQDAQADALKLTTLLSSPRRVVADRGDEFVDIVDETVADNTDAITKAKTAAKLINDKFKDGQPVHWRELLNRDLYRGAQLIDTAEEPNASKNTAPAGGQKVSLLP